MSALIPLLTGKCSGPDETYESLSCVMYPAITYTKGTCQPRNIPILYSNSYTVYVLLSMESCSINPLISFVYHTLQTEWASQVVSVVKNPPANAGDMRRRFSPWVGKIPWRRAWQPTPVFLPGEFHGQRSLAGYSPWGHKESDTTEGLGMAQSFTTSQRP